jgi:hypothetical protein
MGGQQMIEWKSEAGDTRRHSACQKERSPACQPFGGEQYKTTNPEPIPTKLINT